jgi:hypothetical protein
MIIAIKIPNLQKTFTSLFPLQYHSLRLQTNIFPNLWSKALTADQMESFPVVCMAKNLRICQHCPPKTAHKFMLTNNVCVFTFCWRPQLCQHIIKTEAGRAALQRDCDRLETKLVTALSCGSEPFCGCHGNMMNVR